MPKYTSNLKFTVVRRFLLIFTVISIVFCMALIPIFAYLQNVFGKLQLEKISQRMNMGITQIENMVSGVLNTSQTLSKDLRFIPLYYRDPDYSNIPTDIQIQLRKIFDSLTAPLDNIATDAVLLLDENVAVFPEKAFWNNMGTKFYPDFFCVDDLSYQEWYELLEENMGGFMPVHHITAYEGEYDAIIYAIRWGHSAYLYATLDVTTLKNLLIADSEQSDCYFSLTRTDGTVLYSDLPETEQDFRTLSSHLSSGNIDINIYIAKTLFYQKMEPLYFFLMLYGLSCLVLLVLIILTGTHLSSNPILGILTILESCRNIFNSDTEGDGGMEAPGRRNDFDYISNSILSADKHLEQYQQLIDTQQKILQARFLEKAINGQLTDPKDVMQFHCYFPDFPSDGYYLLLMRLQSNTDKAEVSYNDPMLLLQTFLQSELPNAYQQQFSDYELILLITRKDMQDYVKLLDFLVDNINREEPFYTIYCISSKCCQTLENLPAAYRQLQSIGDLPCSDIMKRVCTVDDCVEIPASSFPMTELMTLYTAISYGNVEVALGCLTTFSEILKQNQNNALKRNVYEMIRTTLTCIKTEHPLQFMDDYIPAYNERYTSHEEDTLYHQLADLIQKFAEQIRQETHTNIDPFVQEIIEYIDERYTDCDLCVTTLASHFDCSSSTIYKAFKNAMNMTPVEYIEQKRMGRANELLAQKQKMVVEIAAECGYASLNSFYKAYKRIYGHAPTRQGADAE
ncbi:MAG: helix-turn-helix transcriptional regulator [Lachnospiraceae bacterium]|nr:helix-turn-helix transcriptional regulator [Lachnospiraceae bacterium]